MIVGLIYNPLFEAVRMLGTELSFRECILTNNNGNLYEVFFVFQPFFPNCRRIWGSIQQETKHCEGSGFMKQPQNISDKNPDKRRHVRAGLTNSLKWMPYKWSPSNKTQLLYHCIHFWAEWELCFLTNINSMAYMWILCRLGINSIWVCLFWICPA